VNDARALDFASVIVCDAFLAVLDTIVVENKKAYRG